MNNINIKTYNSSNKYEKYEISTRDDGIRLTRWFQRHFPRISFPRIATMLRKGIILLNGRCPTLSDIVQSGQEIIIINNDTAPNVNNYPLIQENNNEKRKIWLSKSPKFIQLSKQILDWVIFKNDEIILINKPQGIAVQGGNKVKISLDDLLDNLKFGLTSRPKIVHRLDAATSGALLLGRTSNDAAILSQFFREHKIIKKYLAICWGCPEVRCGMINFPLYKSNKGANKELIVCDYEKGKYAESRYSVIDSDHNRNFSLIEIEIVTGRMHQARIHLSMLGCPIIGDIKYDYRYLLRLNAKEKQIMNINKSIGNRKIIEKIISGASYDELLKIIKKCNSDISSNLLLHSYSLAIPKVIQNINSNNKIDQNTFLKLKAKIPDHFIRAMEYFGLKIN